MLDNLPKLALKNGDGDMSGGYFDYKQFEISRIVEQIEDVVYKCKNPEEAEYARNFDAVTIENMEKAIFFLEIAEIYTCRIDWLLSGDDGEETFKKRLYVELEEYFKEKSVDWM